ncbi:archaea-specific SMC-related protein [Haladaptatus sp. SPP-AMP-3]|uniref:archaea-specific SMC-related protein n=1 Tax=Haladaptatus sp. SPP-AMP-3 TaxID=3121295 RepID=UPI003C2FF18F
MSSSNGPARLVVDRIGGIDSTTVELTPGVSILTGRNATNRTSLLQALMGALGSEAVSLKGDATEGQASLTIGDETYTRTLRRTENGIELSGDPFLDDPTSADLFAFLLESNDARRAVANETDLRDLIMRSVDIDAVHEEISDLRSEHRTLETRIAELSTLESEFPELRERRFDLEATIADLEESLEEHRGVVNRIRDERTEQEGDPDDRLERLRELNTDLEDVRFELDAERESVAALEDDATEIHSELESYPEAPAAELSDVEDELEDLRGRKDALDTEITDIQRTIQFNERLLDGEEATLVTREDSTSEVDDDEVVCWTCGSTVERVDIERTVEHLRTLRDERREARAEATDRIETLRTRRSELEEIQRQRSELEAELDAIEREQVERETRVDSLKEREEMLKAEIEEIESAIEPLTTADQADLLDAHRDMNRLEFELEQRRDDLETIVSEIDEIETELDLRDELQDRQQEIESRIEDLRGRIGEIERNAVAEFNEHMAQVLGILEYTKLSRIWIERQHEESADTSELPTGRFVLHIERRTDDGTTYEDIIDHLSESEREVTGLVFAFAGYLIHDVYESVPFLLLDSLEAVDAIRIKRLINYVRPYTDYLVVALLSEDARALPDFYQRIRDI